MRQVGDWCCLRSVMHRRCHPVVARVSAPKTRLRGSSKKRGGPFGDRPNLSSYCPTARFERVPPGRQGPPASGPAAVVRHQERKRNLRSAHRAVGAPVEHDEVSEGIPNASNIAGLMAQDRLDGRLDALHPKLPDGGLDILHG